MDKQTLSNYGWLTIVTLILAVMLALATPFGTYVGDAVVSVANGFVGASDAAIDEDNIATNEDKWDSKFDYSGFKEDELVVFTILNNEAKEFRAEKGMTWGEWIESEYNIDGYEVGIVGFEGLGDIEVITMPDTGKLIYEEIDGIVHHRRTGNKVTANGTYVLKYPNAQMTPTIR